MINSLINLEEIDYKGQFRKGHRGLLKKMWILFSKLGVENANVYTDPWELLVSRVGQV